MYNTVTLLLSGMPYIIYKELWINSQDGHGILQIVTKWYVSPALMVVPTVALQPNTSVVGFFSSPSLCCQTPLAWWIASPSKSFWSGASDSFVAVKATVISASFSGCTMYMAYSHAGQWVRLTARGFLLVFCSNHSPTMHHFELGVWDRQTDGQTDRGIA